MKLWWSSVDARDALEDFTGGTDNTLPLRPNFWFQQEQLTPKEFMKNVVSLQLKNQYLQEWDFEVHRNRKCTIYRTFKDQISFEPYLSKLNFIDRRALCRFRTGSHTLPVAKSRYVAGGGGVDANCKLCTSHEVCDEFHVIFVCKYFEEHRKKYLKKKYLVRPNTQKMYTLFNANVKETANLAKFIRYILSRF